MARAPPENTPSKDALSAGPMSPDVASALSKRPAWHLTFALVIRWCPNEFSAELMFFLQL